MNILSNKKAREAVLKTLSVLTGVATVLSLSGILYLAPEIASAVAPKDYGLKEGNTISAAGSADPDVYIVNDWGYKRLFLNPVIFGFYGHLGGFAKVKNVSAATRDAFGTSGLFRLDGDQKVYGVETTGEDTGILHWVNTSGAQAVADDPNFFKKVFVINQNEFNWYSKGSNYTSVNQVPNYTRVAGATTTPSVAVGAVGMSLASDNPGAASITRRANGVTYLKLNLSGTGTLSSLRVVRGGPGSPSDFANVYIYDGARRLTSGRSPSSSDGSITFSGLNIAINGSKVISVVADMTASGTNPIAGNVNYFYIASASDAVLSSGTTGGSFPLNGNNMTVTGQVGGTLTIDKVGSLANPNVGQSNVELSEFKLTTATEGAKISRLQLIQGGTVKYGDMNNLRLEVNGVKVADGSMTSDGYAVFDFGATPYVIAKGDNRIFRMYGNLAGKKSETVNFYFEVTADSLAVGDQFGFGLTVTNNMSTSGTGHTLTLQGGVLTISFVGPTATNVSTTTTKTHFLDFDMAAASAIELRKHTLVLCKDDGGNGTYDANSDTTNGWSDIINISIIDRDTGVALVGPQDGSAFTTSNTSCPGGVAGAAKQFTDVFNLSAGETKHLAVVGDVKTANTGGVQITSGDVVKVIIDGYGDNVGSSGDLTIAKYTGTNTALVNTDIVPSGDVSGNGMTVQGSSLTLALASSPTGNLSYVKGTKNVNTLGLNFSTALGNPVTVTDLTLTGYVADSGTTMNKGIGAAPDTALNVGLLAAQVRLIDASTGASVGTLTTNNLSVSTGTAKFNNLAWAIPGGVTKTLLVQTDLSTNNTSGSLDTFAFDIAATSDVTAIDANSNTINPNATVNGAGSSPTTYVTVNSVGTLKAAGVNQPTSAAVYWSQKNAPYANYRFTSTNEAFFIERLNLYTHNTAADLVNNIDTITLSYKNKAGSTLTTNGTFNNAGSISFAFSGDAKPYVPKDNSADVTVSANLKSASQLFRAGNKNFSIDLSVSPLNGTNGDEFRAVGEGSGLVLDGATSGSALLSSTGAALTTVNGNAMYVYRSWPKFTGLVITDANASIIPGSEVYRFKVDAMGDPVDGAVVYFDGATANTSGSVKFAVLASGSVTNTLGFDLRDTDDNSLIATRSLSNTNVTSGAPTAASASFRFQDVSTNKQIQIPAGSSKTFSIKLNSTTVGFSSIANNSGRAADYLQLLLRDNENNLVYWTNNGGTGRNHSDGSTAGVLRDFSTTTGQRLRAK